MIGKTKNPYLCSPCTVGAWDGCCSPSALGNLPYLFILAIVSLKTTG